jgi:hypothetical protein
MKNGTLGGMACGIVCLLTVGAAQAASTAQERDATRALNLQQAHIARPVPAPNAAPAQITDASVFDAEGNPVGAVQKVELQDGAPSRIEISILGNGSPVTLDASQFLYEPAQNRITARPDAGTLVRMAQAQ